MRIIFLALTVIAWSAATALAQQSAPKPSNTQPSGVTSPEPGTPASKPAAASPAAPPPARTKKPAKAVPKSTSPNSRPEGSSASQPARGVDGPAAAAPAAAPPGANEASAARHAKERQELERRELEQMRSTTLNLIRLLVEQGVLTREKAEQLVLEADRGAIAPKVAPPPSEPPPPAPAPPSDVIGLDAAPPPAQEGMSRAERRKAQTVRVPYIPEVVRNQIRDEVREEVLAQAKTERWGEPGAMPQWLDRISLDGDLRFRYQGNYYSDSNTPVQQYNALTGSNVSNTTEDEARYAIRARLGVNAKISEPLAARLSITTGNALNPISLNQNFANSFSGYGAQIDQAYLRYTPAAWGTAWLGRMPKPFVTTEMLFWEDINMDGAATTLRRKFDESADVFLTGGAFLIQNSPSTATTPNPKTKSLLALQLGGSVDVAAATRFNAAAAYYDYQNMEGIPNPTLNSQAYDWTAPQFRQKGNTLFNIDNDGNPATNTFALASKFKIVNLNASLDLAQFDPYVVRLSGDYVQNLGFDRAEIQARTGRDIEKRATGYQVSLLVGKLQIKQLHDWHAFVIYRRLGRDAVVDAFNDPDFNLGGTNHKGYQLGLRYGIAPDTWFRVRWTSADTMDAYYDTAQPQPIRFSADVLQVDLNTRF